MFRRQSKPVVQVEWLVVGLGNPGPEYARTRHNVGFDLIDELADRHGIKLGTAQHKARFGVGTIGGVGVVLVKPMTYMNLSGQSVAPLAKSYGVKPEKIVVIADDLDLEVGRTRLKPKGGAGGHNGHKSLIHSLGTQEYPRLKIGIGKGDDETIDHVLGKFNPEERVEIEKAIRKGADGIEVLVQDGLEAALNKVNV